MLDDIARMMRDIGLDISVSKLKWLSNRWANHDENSYLEYNGSRIYESEAIKILGSWFRSDLKEMTAVTHRIQCAWACYNRWSHILESNTPIKNRVTLWAKTCLRSLLWGLQTTRALRKRAAQRLLT